MILKSETSQTSERLLDRRYNQVYIRYNETEIYICIRFSVGIKPVMRPISVLPLSFTESWENTLVCVTEIILLM